MQALRDDTVSTQPCLGSIRRFINQLADHLAQTYFVWPDGLFDNLRESWRRLGHLASHQLAPQRRALNTEYSPQVPLHDRCQFLFRRQVLGNGRFFGEAACSKNFPIQSDFVAEVVVDRGDIGSSAVTNLPHGGVLKPLLGEYLTRRFDQTTTRLFSAGFLRESHNGFNWGATAHGHSSAFSGHIQQRF